ncbi:SDR family oxidoreductase [Lentilactobacillus hilgardii]|nr:SDR family oxidoreductase [Lentilactobacillus hilgardii]MCV3740645.1 SDR family oxidoreductase [Lentilactobacillus hilgardii]
MTKNVLIMAANGQIARLVEDRILNEEQLAEVHLTLFLRDANRLANLSNNSRVTLIEGSLDKPSDVKRAVTGQDIVFVGVVDHTSDAHQTQYVVDAMKESGVKRLVYTNVLGIYDEVPGAYGEWNKETIGSGLPSALRSDQIMEKSGLDYTTLRLPWLNDRDVKYDITHKGEPYLGVSGSRKSIADVVVRIIANPDFLKNDSVGIADPATQGNDRPVY